MNQHRLALAAFIAAMAGIVLAFALFSAIYFHWITDIGYVWVLAIVLAFELPALGMSIAVRTTRLGRAALALASSVLIGIAVVGVLTTPARVETDRPSSEEPLVEQAPNANAEAPFSVLPAAAVHDATTSPSG